MKHLFSESALWKTTAEFVAPDGTISRAEGESLISIRGTEIINESWVQLGELRRTNNYKITPVSATEFNSESLNMELGKQIGVFNIDRSTIYSKFEIEGSAFGGYEIICREGDICYVQGALYDGNTLINTWSATMHNVED